MTALPNDPPETEAAILSLVDALAEPEPVDWENPIKPEDLARANRFGRRVAILDQQADAIRSAANSQRADIDAWEARELGRIGRSKSWFVRGLEAFARNAHERGGPKSIRLASGHTLALTKPRGHVEVLDEAAFLSWALGCSCGHPKDAHNTPRADCTVGEDDGPLCPCTRFEPQAPNLVRETAPKPAETHPAKTELGKLPNKAGVLLLDGETVPGVAYEIAPEDVFKIEPGDES